MMYLPFLTILSVLSLVHANPSQDSPSMNTTTTKSNTGQQQQQQQQGDGEETQSNTSLVLLGLLVPVFVFLFTYGFSRYLQSKDDDKKLKVSSNPLFANNQRKLRWV